MQDVSIATYSDDIEIKVKWDASTKTDLFEKSASTCGRPTPYRKVREITVFQTPAVQYIKVDH